MTKKEYYAKKQKEIDLKNKKREEDIKLFREEIKDKCLFLSIADTYHTKSNSEYLCFLDKQCKDFNAKQVKLIYKKTEIEELKKIIEIKHYVEWIRKEILKCIIELGYINKTGGYFVSERDKALKNEIIYNTHFLKISKDSVIYKEYKLTKNLEGF